MEQWLSDEQAKAICRHRAVTNEWIRKQLNSGTKVPRATWMQWAHEYDAVHTILKVLAGICDGAKSHDGVGFNKVDSNTGKRLAYQSEMNNKEFWTGVRIVRKYHRQIDPALMAWVPRPRNQQ
jgi:hypothetical protein